MFCILIDHLLSQFSNFVLYLVFGLGSKYPIDDDKRLATKSRFFAFSAFISYKQKIIMIYRLRICKNPPKHVFEKEIFNFSRAFLNILLQNESQ